MLRPEHFSSSSKFSRKNTLEDRACWKSIILRLVWMRLQLGKEIAPENRTKSQLKKVKKGAVPDHTGVSNSPLPAAEANSD
jgi:hypothetical protein